MRIAVAAAFVAATFLTAFAHAAWNPAPVLWDGGDGKWTDSNWNGGQTIKSQFGEEWNRSRGYRSAAHPSTPPDDLRGERIIIGGGATVLFDSNSTRPDDPLNYVENLQIWQGSALVIKEGATWQQVQNATFVENYWTQIDASALYLDNGTFRRTGAVPGEGPGAFMFGSWQGDDTFSVVPGPQVIDVTITNGGRLENEGQMWLGAEDDNSEGLIVNFVMNDGAIDLTGGEIPPGDYSFAQDLAFWSVNYLGDPLADPPIPDQFTDYHINFGGPGSITTDNGIRAMTKIVPFGSGSGSVPWVSSVDGSDPPGTATWEDLWDIGYLRAYGKSGLDGETFGDYFSVSGNSPTGPDYTLTSLVAQIPGDANLDGAVNGLDVAAFVNYVVSGDYWKQADTNDDGAVNGLDVNSFIALVISGGGAQAVPEPSTMALAGLGLLGLAWFARRRR